MFYTLAHQILPKLLLQPNGIAFRNDDYNEFPDILNAIRTDKLFEAFDHHLLIRREKHFAKANAKAWLVEENDSDDFDAEALMLWLMNEETESEQYSSVVKREREFPSFTPTAVPDSITDYINDDDFMWATWFMAYCQSGLEEVPPMDNYTLEHQTVGNLEVLLFTFPYPIHMPGAYFAAAIRGQNQPYRYFTLEKTYSHKTPEKSSAVLGEWLYCGNHLNHGRFRGDINRKDEFLAAVLEMLHQSTDKE